MFSKHESYNKHIFVNTIKVDKKKESKTTPHVSTKISAYDRVVQIVTNNDNNDIKPEEEAQKSTYDYLDNYLSLFVLLKTQCFQTHPDLLHSLSLREVLRDKLLLYWL